MWHSLVTKPLWRTRNSIKFENPEAEHTWPMEVIGHFEGFGRKRKKFEFYVLQSGLRIIGAVDSKISDTPLHDEIRVGHTARYQAKIQARQVGSKEPKYLLLEFSAISEST